MAEIPHVSPRAVAHKALTKHQSFMPGARAETDAYHLGHWYVDVGMRSTNYRPPIAWHNYRDGSASSLRVGDVGIPRKENQGTISGLVLDDSDNPLSRVVRCMDRETGVLIYEIWSKQDGSYEFKDLELEGKYSIVAVDYTETYNAVIADNVSPEPVV